ncbi:hypothetical protein TUM9812_13890 [Escherichia coli]|nr:hypothetical protein TUM9812_13890 [Escherichia coli]
MVPHTSKHGASLNILLDKNNKNVLVVLPVFFISPVKLLAIKYPDIAKNISTPAQ